MTDREIAESLGTHVALSSPLASTWYRVAHGEQSPEEAAERLESPEEQEDARQIFTPLTPEQQEAALTALLERLEREASTSPSVDNDIVVSRPWWRTPPWGLALLAVAATLLLVISMPRPSSEPLELSTGYTLEPLRGHTLYRGSSAAPAEIPTYALGGPLSATLRPDHEESGPLDAVAFARNTDGEALRLRLSVEVKRPSGTVILTANVRGAGLDEGTWELLFAVGRPEALPSSWEEVAAAQEDDEVIGYEVVGQSIHVVRELAKQ